MAISNKLIQQSEVSQSCLQNTNRTLLNLSQTGQLGDMATI